MPVPAEGAAAGLRLQRRVRKGADREGRPVGSHPRPLRRPGHGRADGIRRNAVRLRGRYAHRPRGTVDLHRQPCPRPADRRRGHRRRWPGLGRRRLRVRAAPAGRSTSPPESAQVGVRRRRHDRPGQVTGLPEAGRGRGRPVGGIARHPSPRRCTGGVSNRDSDPAGPEVAWCAVVPRHCRRPGPAPGAMAARVAVAGGERVLSADRERGAAGRGPGRGDVGVGLRRRGRGQRHADALVRPARALVVHAGRGLPAFRGVAVPAGRPSGCTAERRAHAPGVHRDHRVGLPVRRGLAGPGQGLPVRLRLLTALGLAAHIAGGQRHHGP